MFWERRIALVRAENPRPGHATRRYSLIRPPARVCLRTRYCSRSTGSGSGFSGAAPCRERCGRCWLWWVSYWGRIRRRWCWFQTRVRSGSSRRHPPIQRSAIAFMRGVRTLPSTVRILASARIASKVSVKLEPRSRIMNLTRCVCSLRSMSRFAGLLGGPLPGRVQGDAEDADAPGRVLGQDVSLSAAGQAGCEEVACQDRVGLGAQELRPGRPGPPRRGAGAVGLEDLPYGRRRDLDSQPGQLRVDPAVAPFGVVAGQPEDEGPDGLAGGRPAGPAAHGPRRLAVPDDVAVPAHDGVRGDQQPQSVAAGFGYHAEQCREQGPVRPVELRAARLLPLQDRKLVAQDQNLGDLPRILTPGQPQPSGDPPDEEGRAEARRD